MAVQKSRRTRSTRGNRRLHDKLSSATLSIDSETGEIHRRHHLTPKGFYRGQQIIPTRAEKVAPQGDSSV